ncbi:hypothetical protein ACFYTQ_04945 [Nocardia sp. NPDC004068]|uniref:hypothetical protein n=1 Tax=Nocardia sp. NPDC004068 TaxID=3364303 RepID=UPI003696C66C
MTSSIGAALWPAPRRIGQSNPFVWAIVDEANATTPQFPFGNGSLTLKDVGPGGIWPEWARVDSEPGIRSPSFAIDYVPTSNSWHVMARSPLASADFTADHPVPGSFYRVPVDGDGTEPTDVDAVINSRVTGSVTMNGRTIDVTGWRGEYWRMSLFPSLIGSQLDPGTSWRGWEWTDVMEPDGGSSQFYGFIGPNGRYSGVLVDARPTGTRICSKTTVEFGDYAPGRSMYGDHTPPMRQYAVPGRITVTCAPGERFHMTKTFYPDSRDYADVGIVDFTELPVHTVPGSFGSYEHERYATYRAGH